MQPTPAQVFIFQNLKKLTSFADTTDLCIYEPKKKLYITKSILPEDLGYYQIISGIRHPNLANIDFIMPCGGGYRVVREFISGDCLSDIIEGGTTYPEEKAARMIYELCCGLSALHECNIVHRDINPNNIIITTDGHVKIIDYGIARLYKKNQSKDTVNVGTPGYAAPEQYGFSQSDNRTDIYSIGVLMNVLICSRIPVEQTVGGTAGRIIRKCIQIDAQQRYPNVIALMRDIERKMGIIRSEESNYPSDRLADKIMRNIPGIRTGKIYFMLPALIWYALVVLIIISSFVRLKPAPMNYIAWFFTIVLVFIFPTFCFHNVLDIWDRFPFSKGSSRKSQRGLFFLIGGISICIGLLFMAYLGTTIK